MADPVPDTLPPFLSEVHSREPLPIFGDQPMYTGVRRRRRISSAVRKPAYISIEWDLSQQQVAIMHDWYENTLLAGSLSFLADVAALGPGLNSAVELLWVEPPVATPSETGRWRVTGKCLLDGVAPVPTFTASGASQPIYPKLQGRHTQASGFGPAPLLDTVRLVTAFGQMTFLAAYQALEPGVIELIQTFDPTTNGSNIILSNGDNTAACSAISSALTTPASDIHSFDMSANSFCCELIVEQITKHTLLCGVFDASQPYDKNLGFQSGMNYAMTFEFDPVALGDVIGLLARQNGNVIGFVNGEIIDVGVPNAASPQRWAISQST